MNDGSMQQAKQHLDQDEAFLLKFKHFITFHISEFTSSSSSVQQPQQPKHHIHHPLQYTTIVASNNGEPSRDALLTALSYFLQHYKSSLSGPHVASIIQKLEKQYSFPFTPLVQLFLSELVFSRKLFTTCCDVVWHLVSNYLQARSSSSENMDGDFFHHIGSNRSDFSNLQQQQQQQQLPIDDDMNFSYDQQQQQHVQLLLKNNSLNSSIKSAIATASQNEFVAYHCFTFLQLHIPSHHTLHPVLLKEMFPFINSRKNIKFDTLFKLAVQAKWISMDSQDEIIRLVQQLIQPLAYDALMHTSGNIGYSSSHSNTGSTSSLTSAMQAISISAVSKNSNSSLGNHKLHETPNQQFDNHMRAQQVRNNNNSYQHHHNHHHLYKASDKLITHAASLVSDLLFAWKNYGLPAKLVSFLEDEQVLATQVVSAVQVILKCFSSWTRQQQVFFVRQLVMMNADCMRYEKRLADMFVDHGKFAKKNNLLVQQQQHVNFQQQQQQSFSNSTSSSSGSFNQENEQLQNKSLMSEINIDGVPIMNSNHLQMASSIAPSTPPRSSLAKKKMIMTPKRSRLDFVMDHMMTNTEEANQDVQMDGMAISSGNNENNNNQQVANQQGNESAGNSNVVEQLSVQMQHVTLGANKKQRVK